MIRIAHIINPVIVRESSDLYVAQPVTFKTMLMAKSFSKGYLQVDLYSAQFPEDRSLIPQGFISTPDLNRSILDLKIFERNRKLPFINDILDRLYNASIADYFIYTNVDISLVPYFYNAVGQIIEKGYDAFVINRRTVPKQKFLSDNLSYLFACIGEKHPGFDCFIFKREYCLEFELGDACIGAGKFGKILTANLIKASKRFKIFKDLHLTFHLGDDQNWRAQGNSGYDIHNQVILERLLKKYKAQGMLNHPVQISFLSTIERRKRLLYRLRKKLPF